MNISAYDLALGGGFTIVGVLVGGIITYRFSICLNKIVERRQAGAQLRAAFAAAIAKYELIANSEIDAMLRQELPAHAIAIEVYRSFVPKGEQKNYQKAWDDYHRPSGANGSIYFLDYMIGNNRKELFNERIQAILIHTDL